MNMNTYYMACEPGQAYIGRGEDHRYIKLDATYDQAHQAMCALNDWDSNLVGVKEGEILQKARRQFEADKANFIFYALRFIRFNGDAHPSDDLRDRYLAARARADGGEQRLAIAFAHQFLEDLATKQRIEYRQKKSREAAEALEEERRIAREKKLGFRIRKFISGIFEPQLVKE